MKQYQSLEEIRVDIDSIDEKLLALLTERANCSLQVARIKQDTDGATPEFYRPEREAQILRRVAGLNDGPLDDQSVQRIFREIISSSLALEQRMTVAYLGPEGTFTYSAAQKHFGRAPEFRPCAGIDEIFRVVESGNARFGVVPIENSTEGMVTHTLDTLAESRLRVCGECRLRIEHNLLGNVDSLAAIRSVHAHPQALAQCRHWLDEHLPRAERITESSNAAAVQLVAGRHDAVAIAGLSAAGLYDVAVLEKNIEDISDNTTRFFVVGDTDVPPSGNDSTTLLISVPHKPGGLRRLLEPFDVNGISLTRIESRPSRTNLWEYNFFIDVCGHQQDETLSAVLTKLSHEVHLLRVLGSYPSAL